MPLSIHNPRAEKLARELAAKSGQTITQAIINALEDRLLRIQGKKEPVDLAGEMLKIAHRCGRIPDKDSRNAEQILNYNQEGVPE
ncbi:MAG: type II toxin-antitoxin system VapB family antitoxin [Thermodesulfobacteriota bacterium]